MFAFLFSACGGPLTCYSCSSFTNVRSYFIPHFQLSVCLTSLHWNRKLELSIGLVVLCLLNRHFMYNSQKHSTSDGSNPDLGSRSKKEFWTTFWGRLELVGCNFQVWVWRKNVRFGMVQKLCFWYFRFEFTEIWIDFSDLRFDG